MSTIKNLFPTTMSVVHSGSTHRIHISIFAPLQSLSSYKSLPFCRLVCHNTLILNHSNQERLIFSYKKESWSEFYFQRLIIIFFKIDQTGKSSERLESDSLLMGLTHRQTLLLQQIFPKFKYSAFIDPCCLSPLGKLGNFHNKVEFQNSLVSFYQFTLVVKSS